MLAKPLNNSEENAKWNFIEEHVAIVIPPQFDEVFSFRNGRAVVPIGAG